MDKEVMVMNEWCLAAGMLGMAGFGFWLMCRLDHFLSSGGLRPQWEAETDLTGRSTGEGETAEGDASLRR